MRIRKKSPSHSQKRYFSPLFTPAAEILRMSFLLAAGTASPLADPLQGKLILAPLTRGGNLPFRQLCSDFGMQCSIGEMVYARQLLKGDRQEAARLRRAANEQFFGVQIATNDLEEGVRAAKLAAEAGADFVDLNCGCPIHEATRRGLGSALLRNPTRLAALVEGLASGSPLPVSVKVRTAAEGGEVNVRQVAAAVLDAGAAALTIHGRTAQDRYTKAADWSLIAQVVEDCRARSAGVRWPVVGNGDVRTHSDATREMAASGVDAVMVGRGALIKPWLFGEYAAREAWEPTAEERVGVYRQLTAHMQARRTRACRSRVARTVSTARLRGPRVLACSRARSRRRTLATTPRAAPRRGTSCRGTSTSSAVTSPPTSCPTAAPTARAAQGVRCCRRGSTRRATRWRRSSGCSTTAR